MKKLVLILLCTALLGTSLTSCYKECTCQQDKTLTTQPGPNDGQDCLVAYRTGDGGVHASTNLNANPDFSAWYWTFNAEGQGEGPGRTYFKFPALSGIPQSATIKSAKLSLYGVSKGNAIIQGNSYYPGSGYNVYGDNKAWLKRVLSDWDENTITWNNKPATTDVNRVEFPATASQWNFDVLDLDVTPLVKDMVSSQQNYGFVMQMQVEQIYRCNIFASSEHPEAAKRPKLVVVYHQ